MIVLNIWIIQHNLKNTYIWVEIVVLFRTSVSKTHNLNLLLGVKYFSWFSWKERIVSLAFQKLLRVLLYWGSFIVSSHYPSCLICIAVLFTFLWSFLFIYEGSFNNTALLESGSRSLSPYQFFHSHWLFPTSLCS